jgi:ABC-type nitrate/sulfonate/bicarbonate transport system substrate-binding protein
MADLVKVNAGFATIGQGAGPLMVTWKAGLFEKYGLDVPRPAIMGGANGVVRGLTSGEIQFGNMAAPAPLRANLRGEADLVFLTGGINQQFIMGRPVLTRREQLAGKKIGFVGDGGLNDALVRFIIEKLAATDIHGLREESVPSSGDKAVEALLNGRCDAIVVTPPECIDAARKGCRYLVDFGEYGFNSRWAESRRVGTPYSSIPRSRGGSSKRTSKACTVTGPIETLPSACRRNTAVFRTAPSPRKPTISPGQGCRPCRFR